VATNPTTAPTPIPPARSVMPPPPMPATSPIPPASPIPEASPIPDASPIPERSDHEAQLPFAGYDRLNARQVRDGLSGHSQVELEAVESYERSHEAREAVLNKLRYLRGSEPVAGYDALSVEEIFAVVRDADLETITRVRGYERKFANRPRVLDEVGRVHRERRALQPASAAPAYQPTSYQPMSAKG
jgi:hypothetical protein